MRWLFLILRIKNILTDQKEHLRQERSILEQSNFAFLIKLEFAFQTRTDLYMVMEYACGGELLFHLQRANGFDEERAAFYTRIGWIFEYKLNFKTHSYKTHRDEIPKILSYKPNLFFN